MNKDQRKRFWVLAGLAIGLLINGTLAFNYLVGCFVCIVYVALVIGISEACYLGTLHALRKVLMEDAEREAIVSQPTDLPRSPSSDTV